MRVAGIMSGTSLDGADVAIVEIGRRVRTLAYRTLPYPRKLRDRILAVSSAPSDAASISRLHFLLPEFYARALGDWVRAYRVQLIGCHGQTIYHEPGGNPPNTFQIGDGSVLAELAGVPVVSDFRPRDIAAGGQGAPLVPFVDYRLFRHRRLGRVALNIGGIANLTAIPPAALPADVFAFDTGPGNMVIDELVSRSTGGRRRFDKDGRIAAQGRLSRTLLDRLLADKFFSRRPPKSTGRERYGSPFVDKMCASGLPSAGLVATATALTVCSIALGIRRFVMPRMTVDEVIVSGGGVHNPQLIAGLAAMMPRAAVRSSDELGVNPDAKEAIAFAILAYETFRGRPSNLPSATGARRPVVLGKLSP